MPKFKIHDLVCDPNYPNSKWVGIITAVSDKGYVLRCHLDGSGKSVENTREFYQTFEEAEIQWAPWPLKDPKTWIKYISFFDPREVNVYDDPIFCDIHAKKGEGSYKFPRLGQFKLEFSDNRGMADPTLNVILIKD